ncbi:MAG: choice-of-anchor tandem repeat GloVer-containing protein [Candidatus Korobacteraceae bacterium]
MSRSEKYSSSVAVGLAVIAGLLLVLLTVVAVPAQTFRVLHTFTGQGDGANPVASLVMGGEGRFYGTTSGGYGSVFKLALSASGGVLSPLHDFSYPVNGGDVLYGPVTFGPDGNLYGTALDGGQGDCNEGGGCGTVFKLQPPASVCKSFLCPWTETVLYRFQGPPDGGNPYSGVLFDQAGNMYGTTAYGGNGGCDFGAGCGAVYKLTPSGGGWTESIIHNFVAGADGQLPAGGLIFDRAGNLYGTTANGGPTGIGIIYQLTPSGSGWTETILHTFQGADGAVPYDTLISDQEGNLYGTSIAGGATNGGTVFELSHPGSWTYNLLHSFADDGPYAGVVFDTAGNLYGATTQGGANGSGSVFKLTPSNGVWTETVLHSFSFGDGDGAQPLGGVTLDSNGNIYGTASDGGGFFTVCDIGCGTVWEITP